MRKTVPRAFFIHCRAHKLNLALQETNLKVQESRNCISSVNCLYAFISGSNKRYANFQNEQLSSHQTSLKALSETRWAYRKHSFNSLVKIYPFVLNTLELDEKAFFNYYSSTQLSQRFREKSWIAHELENNPYPNFCWKNFANLITGSQ